MLLDRQCPVHPKSQRKAHPQGGGRYISEFNIIIKFRLISLKCYFMFCKDWNPIIVSALEPMMFFRERVQEI